MICLLIGHRGVGKTHFLKEFEDCLHKYNQEVVIADLDAEIERTTQKTIEDIFYKEGEAAFREIEEKTLFRVFSWKY